MVFKNKFNLLEIIICIIALVMMFLGVVLDFDLILNTDLHSLNPLFFVIMALNIICGLVVFWTIVKINLNNIIKSVIITISIVVYGIAIYFTVIVSALSKWGR